MTVDPAMPAVDPARFFSPKAGRPSLVYVRETGSTSDLAGRLAADGAPEGTVVVADAQTAGRGRLGRSWLSPAGAGLYVSIVIRPDGPDDRALGALLPLAIGASLAAGLRGLTGRAVELKWPNDLVVRPDATGVAGAAAGGSGLRKIGGVLVEAATLGADVRHAVVGIGINLGQGAYPAALAPRAASLTHAGGSAVDRTELLDVVLGAVADAVADLRAGRTSVVLDRVRAMTPSAVGTTVAWELDGHRLAGVTCGIDADGALRVASGSRVHRMVSATLDWDV